MNMQRQKKIVDETMEICRGFIRKTEQQSMDVFKHAGSHSELDVMFARMVMIVHDQLMEIDLSDSYSSVQNNLLLQCLHVIRRAHARALEGLIEHERMLAAKESLTSAKH